MTSTNTEETLILKTDALGRVRMPSERREAILDAFEKSGLSALAFAKQIGLKYPTFATWVQKRRRELSEHAEKKISGQLSSQVTFVEAQIQQPCQDVLQKGALEVQIWEGVKLMIRSHGEVELAAELIRSLNKPGAC